MPSWRVPARLRRSRPRSTWCSRRGPRGSRRVRWRTGPHRGRPGIRGTTRKCSCPTRSMWASAWTAANRHANDDGDKGSCQRCGDAHAHLRDDVGLRGHDLDRAPSQRVENLCDPHARQPPPDGGQQQCGRDGGRAQTTEGHPCLRFAGRYPGRRSATRPCSRTRRRNGPASGPR